MTSTIMTASASDELSIINTIVLAFATDPMARWSWPDASQYLNVMPQFIRAFGGDAFQRGSAHCTADHRGAALWLPPGASPDENAMGEIIEASVSPAMLGDVYAVIEKMEQFHPAEPHWYLPLMGVDPVLQGQGYGSALLSHALQQCDREGSLAYLESSNPRNIPLYKRHGFRIIGEIQSGSSPTMTAMLRAPSPLK